MFLPMLLTKLLMYINSVFRKNKQTVQQYFQGFNQMRILISKIVVRLSKISNFNFKKQASKSLFDRSTFYTAITDPKLKSGLTTFIRNAFIKCNKNGISINIR